ncbi:MAG: bifunctional pyr operon transcriptional regulator/uracil phosphoribosyltransferase PyrR [Candidatus Dadabacteria bacterium]|nr:bifunctional pyr operon transcriptional regulator/uracil phosphoribosyltransferase PyrR [Candidatus Dadabacteria bacterium]NIS07757.1 bifunctional pyr operon transcriptional regulator/uracil phosphoribosyltransferase PyrR [Candidatus Dadabacteria bacterium]NIV40996.1 bifunctional pyr operon transcriptional regulator/uracil phosphoribosyltransferase PyrR [Candidatus Dadabacteria bacterium]NIX14409.1 bifunctional pyr operon transcriptional regulator/uracil phosphoribosyltransferase PyrR [Candid
MNSDDIDSAVLDISKQLIKSIPDFSNVCFIGIRTRGIVVAKRILSELSKNDITNIPLGTLDITLYRDDLRTKHTWPAVEKTDIGFDVNNKDIIIVDDVMYTGRTARAAIEAVMDYGRPSSIKLIILVDRGSRELPIQPDFTGSQFDISQGNRVNVYLDDVDGREGVEVQSTK